MAETHTPDAPRKKMRRWPLALIGAPAAVAVWSGWVGLGEMSGFGVIHPLPGIADGVTINTAITLPVGVEAYAAYALGAWLSPGVPESARKFAKRSAVGALILGMAGQAAYHLLAAWHIHTAPAAVVVAVASLPVVVLGFAAALTHLLRPTGNATAAEAGNEQPQPTATVSEPETATVAAISRQSAHGNGNGNGNEMVAGNTPTAAKLPATKPPATAPRVASPRPATPKPATQPPAPQRGTLRDTGQLLEDARQAITARMQSHGKPSRVAELATTLRIQTKVAGDLRRQVLAEMGLDSNGRPLVGNEDAGNESPGNDNAGNGDESNEQAETAVGQ